MIYCKINTAAIFPNYFPRTHYNNYKDLVLELQKIIEFIQLHKPEKLFAISIKLEPFEDRIPHSLINFLINQESILFDIEVENHPQLQQRFSNIYQSTLKKWFSAQFQKQKKQQTSLLKDLVPKDNPIELYYLQTEEAPIPHTPSCQWLPQISIKHFNSLESCNSFSLEKQVQTFLQTYENIYQIDDAMQNVIDIFSNIFTILFANMGHEGIFYLLNSLKKLDKEQLSLLHVAMFRKEQGQNILELAHPHSEYFLDIIASWPKNLFNNWIECYSYHSGEPIGFIESIKLLQNFWEPYQDIGIEIPRLRFSDKIHYAILFSNMSALMNATEPKWKKIQFKLLFKLDWQQNSKIFEIKNQGYHFISKEMLSNNHPLHKAYLYLGKTLDNPSIINFESIQHHLHCHQDYAEWVAWLSCLEPLLSAQEIESVIQSLRLYAKPQELLEKLKDFSNKYELPSFIFLNLQKNSQFENLIELFILWSNKNPQLAIHSWIKLMDFYQKHEKTPSFNLAFLKNHHFNEIFLSCLLQTLCDDLILKEILDLFSVYDDLTQKKIIQIFLSIENPHPIQHQALIKFFEQPKDIISSEENFNAHLSQYTFLYFKKMTQWHVIIDDIKNIIKNLRQLLDKFSNKNYIIFEVFGQKFSFYDFIKAPLIQEILSIEAQLQDMQNTIDRLEESPSTEIFDCLCLQFKALENFIEHLLEKKINQNINYSYIIQTLDTSLSDPQANFQKLFAVMEKNYSKLEKLGIEKLFNQNILKLLGQHDSKQSVLERMINENILTNISVSIMPKLEPGIQKCMLNFLGKLKLESKNIEHFFERIKALEQVNCQWPLIVEKLLNRNISPQLIWSICEKYQFIDNHPYASTHWNICFSLIETFIEEDKLADILHQILKARKVFPKKLSFNGEIEHPHWPGMVKQLQLNFQSEMAKNASFEWMLEYTIEHYLKTGEPLRFEEFLKIFEKLQMDARQKLFSLLESHQSKAEFTQFFAKIKNIISAGEKKWIQFVEKCLLAPDFFQYQDQLMSIFNWLEQNIHYPWLEIINDDENCQIQDILELKQNILNLSPEWKSSYPTDPLLQEKENFNDAVAITNNHISMFNWLFPPPSESKVITPIPKPIEHPITKKAWSLWKRPLRPSVQKINQWLVMSPDSKELSTELQNFDTWPHSEPETSVMYWNKELLKTFIDEIEFHTNHLDWKESQKEALLNRLQNILVSIQYLPKTITLLLEQYHQTKNQLMQGVAHSIELENQLISLCVLIYKKTLKKQAYPTQILCLLLALEYGTKNLIYEVDTSEGKSLITALLAVLTFARKENNTVIVRTTHESLVIQDFFQKKHYQFFQLLNCHCDVLIDLKDIERFVPCGIYYTTHLKFEIFNIRSPNFQTQNFDMIADEVDEILDQNRPIYIAQPLPKIQQIDWLYQDMNEFIDSNIASQKKFSTSEWLNQAFKYLLEKNLSYKERIEHLRDIRYKNESFENILFGAIKAYAYVELEDKAFITQKVHSQHENYFKIIPYIDHKPLFDFQFELNGFIQCLAKRLEHQKEVPFIIPPLSEKTAYLNPFNYKKITRFIGLSGSNGKVIELNELTKIFEAQSIRIGRFKPKKLIKLPAIFAPDSQQHQQAIKNIVQRHEQPIVLFCENIQDSLELYHQLRHLPGKTVMCLTGKESNEERENWLLNKEASHHAAAINCVTIGTLILARGIDYSPEHPNGLLGILTYLEESERIETQQNGRPARAGEPGQIISIYNMQSILEKVKKIDIHHVSKDLLLHYKALLQKYKIKQNIEQRHLEQLRLCCWTQLQEMMQTVLKNSDMKTKQLYSYELFKLFDKEWKKSPLSPLAHKDIHIEWMLKIWNHLRIIFHIQNKALNHHSADDFKSELQLSFHWRQMINPDLQNHHFFIKTKDPSSHQSLQQYENNTMDLNFNYQLLIKLNPPDLPQWNLRWLDPLSYQSIKYLHENWEIFKKDPNSENFSYFYESLLAVKKLHELQKQQGELRLDYWFPFLNTLKEWVDFEQKTSQFLKMHQVQTETETHKNFLNLQRTLSKKVEKFITSFTSRSSKTTSGFYAYVQWFFDLIKKLMFTINPQAQFLYSKLQKNIKTAHTERDLRHFEQLHQSMNEFVLYIQTLQMLPFWRIDKYYWLYYFSSVTQQIFDYHQHLSTEKFMLSDFKGWLENKTLTADFRLKCLGHFLCQEQIISQASHIFNPQGEPDAILTHLQEEYLDTGSHFTHYKVYEIGRFFKKELQLKYMSSIEKDKMTTHIKSQAMTQHALYYELAKFVITKHIQDNPETQAHCANTHEQILENELISAENNREFLCLL